MDSVAMQKAGLTSMRILAIMIMIMLTACSTVSTRDAVRTVQSTVNLKNLYDNSTVREEMVWQIRSVLGQ